MHSPPALPEMARWLHQRFQQPPADFEQGRRALREALAGQVGCSPEEADSLLDELERGGYLRYAAEGRSIGGTPGQWIVYASPDANADTDTDFGD
jgi:hypothetical protein